MIYILSIICGISFPIISFLYLTLNHITAWWVALLIAILVVVLNRLIFCLISIFFLYVLGRHYKKLNDPKNPKIWRFMLDIAHFSCFWLGIRIKVDGIEKLKKGEKYVFYGNHQSYIDPLIFHIVLHDFPHASMYKAVIDKYNIASYMAKALGGVSIEREDDRKAMVSIIEIIKKIKSGLNFFIFPEGTRSRGIGMHHFKAGSFKIAQKVDAKMVILAIDGSYRKRLTVPFIYTPVYVKIVDVVDTNSIANENTQELATKYEMLVKQGQLDIRNKHKEMRTSKKDEEKFLIQKEKENVF